MPRKEVGGGGGEEEARSRLGVEGPGRRGLVQGEEEVRGIEQEGGDEEGGEDDYTLDEKHIF